MKTAHRVMDMLESFLGERKDLSISELSDITGLNVTSVHRICSVLKERGYLFQYSNRGKYSLGSKLTEYNLLDMTELKIKEIAAPFMEELGREVSETVEFAFITADDTIDTYLVYSDKRLQVLLDEGGAKTPMHCTGVGKIFLAEQTEKQLEKLFAEKEFLVFTENTITGLNELKKELAAIKNSGVAFDDEEYEIGLRQVAAPVKDANGRVIASAAVLGPSVRISRQRMRELVPTVKAYADKISEALGYKKVSK